MNQLINIIIIIIIQGYIKEREYGNLNNNQLSNFGANILWGEFHYPFESSDDKFNMKRMCQINQYIFNL